MFGTLPPQTARPEGVRLKPAALFPWAQGVRVCRPVTDPKAHTLLLCVVGVAAVKRYPGPHGP